jgi:predicted nucleic-acid-binding Zn-ribbon protein
MNLNGKDTAVLMKHFDSVWPEPRSCAVCGNDSWKLIELVFELREVAESASVQEQDTAVPLVAVTCSRCGNTLFFNAITAGVLTTGGDQQNHDNGQTEDRP